MKIKSKSGEYSVEFSDGLKFLGEYIKEDKNFFVIDKNVYEIYNTNFEKIDNKRLYVLNSAESEKSLITVQKIIEKINGTPYGRETRIIAVGGGIVGDVGGFTASIIYRGVDWVNIPTTLLSCVDSCIGGKTGVNYNGYKNLVGAFYPPKEVVISTEFLSTLKKEDLFSGLGELFKCSVLKGKESLIKLKNDLIKLIELNPLTVKEYIDMSLNVKKELIEKDELDRLGEREKLNLGHTFAHAIEYATENEIKHGLAVIYGIYAVANISYARKYIDKETYDLISNIFNDLTEGKKLKVDFEKFISALNIDKKKLDGSVKFLLIENELKIKITTDISKEEIKSVLEEISVKGEVDQKKIELFNKQKELLDIFLEKGNITLEQYNISLNGLKTKMGL